MAITRDQQLLGHTELIINEIRKHEKVSWHKKVFISLPSQTDASEKMYKNNFMPSILQTGVPNLYNVNIS